MAYRAGRPPCDTKPKRDERKNYFDLLLAIAGLGSACARRNPGELNQMPVILYSYCSDLAVPAFDDDARSRFLTA
jgi:hypothetical protein